MKEEAGRRGEMVAQIAVVMALGFLQIAPNRRAQRTSLRISALASTGNASSASDDAVTATIHCVHPPSDQPPLLLHVKRLAGLGSYEVSHAPEICGRYVVHVMLHGVDICESPVYFVVRPGVPAGAKSRLVPPKEPFITQAQAEVTLIAIDKYGNRLDVGGANINARAQGNAASSCQVVDEKDGTYTINFTQNAVGDCKVIARMDNVDVAPITVSFKAKPMGKDDEEAAKGKKGGKDGAGDEREDGASTDPPSAAGFSDGMAEAPAAAASATVDPPPSDGRSRASSGVEGGAADVGMGTAATSAAPSVAPVAPPAPGPPSAAAPGAPAAAEATSRQPAGEAAAGSPSGGKKEKKAKASPKGERKKGEKKAKGEAK